MFQIIFGLLLGSCFIFLLMYTHDSGVLWQNSLELRRPTLSDIDLSDKSIADKYVLHEICTAHNYFILRNELESPFERDSSPFGTGVYLLAPCVLLSASGLRALTQIQSRILCLAISALALCVLGILVRLLYNRLLKIPPFSYTSEDRSRDRDHLAKFPRTYGESLDTAVNNYILTMHYRYLLDLRKTVRTRIVLRRAINFLALASYVLLFLPVSNH